MSRTPIWGAKEQSSARLKWCLLICFRYTFAHIAKLDEVFDEYVLFIIAQTLLATTLYTELFQ